MVGDKMAADMPCTCVYIHGAFSKRVDEASLVPVILRLHSKTASLIHLFRNGPSFPLLSKNFLLVFSAFPEQTEEVKERMKDRIAQFIVSFYSFALGENHYSKKYLCSCRHTDLYKVENSLMRKKYRAPKYCLTFAKPQILVKVQLCST